MRRTRYALSGGTTTTARTGFGDRSGTFDAGNGSSGADRPSDERKTAKPADQTNPTAPAIAVESAGTVGAVAE